MAEKAKKPAKPSAVLKNIMITAATIALAFFAFLCASGGRLYLFGYIFSCFTAAFFVLTLVLLVRFGIVLNRNKGKLDYTSVILIIASALLLICLVKGGAADVKGSKISDTLAIGDDRTVILTETTEHSDITGKDSTYMSVYLLHGRIASELGRIDETCFSNKCVEFDQYAYAVSEDDETLTIECAYGQFGDGVAALDPAYGSATIKYVFKLK